VILGRQHWTILVVALIAGGIVFAWINRHVEDDAFITFRYSKHLVEGLGPVWNPDQCVEGYTNFLWMLLMAIPLALGMDPVLPATVISLTALALNLWLLFVISRRQTESAEKGFWTWLPIVFSHTLLIFSTSGMETAFNGLLWTLALWQLQPMLRGNKIPSARGLWLLGLTASLAVMSRPEGGLLVIACGLAVFIWLYIARHGIWNKLWHYCAAVALPLAPWLVWKVSFYGHLLPNTFFVKTGSGSMAIGWQYCLIFLLVCGAWIPELVIRTTNVLKRWNFDVFMIVTGGLAGCFLLYMLLAGGDYLEFRMMVPVLPIVILWPAWRLARKALKMRQIVLSACAMVAIALIWGQGHGRFFKIWYLNPAVHVVDGEAQFMSFADQGKALGALLEHDGSIRLAIGACGAIPYYSGFYGIDLYGLNEPRNEFIGYGTGYSPGHGQLAHFDFIKLRRPHLISLRCDYLPDLPAARQYRADDPQIAEVTYGADSMDIRALRVVELPLGSGFAEVCLYYRSQPRIDSVIKANSLKIYSLQ
jgi:arabinofuranosyltransferase